MKTIEYIVRDAFTRTPGLRYRKQGPYSGQQFREDVLEDLMAEYDHVILDMNGCYGFGNSFIDEAFGVLAGKVSKKKVLDTFEVRLSDNPRALAKISERIDLHEAKRLNK